MKTKISLLLLVTILFFACSKEGTLVENDPQNLETQIIDNSSSPDSRSSFTCKLGWTAPTATALQGQVIQVHYSQDPQDYPGGVIDIYCARQEFFSRYCELRMNVFQNPDPYIDSWVIVYEGTCLPRPEDDVDTAILEDPRTCVGSACTDGD